MKKVFILGALCVVALASCKKDYSCKCTYTSISDGETTVYVDTYEVEGADKTQAQAACNEATISVVDGNDSESRTCELK